MSGWIQLMILLVGVGALSLPVGDALYGIFEGSPPRFLRWLGPLEKALLWGCGVPTAAEVPREQTWRRYALALLAFHGVGTALLFLLLKVQGWLPLDPTGAGAMGTDLALNTAVSFVTNTNWQAYVPEQRAGYLVQMVGLTWQNFVSAASGLAVAMAVARGLTRRSGVCTLGHFQVDLIRATVYVLLPVSLLAALFFVSEGVVQTLGPRVVATTLEGEAQLISVGPVASQEAIKLLGTNGGGFFAANSAHPFENPTPWTNLVQMGLILLLPVSLARTWGHMTGDLRQGWALLGAMALLFVLGAVAILLLERGPAPAWEGLAVSPAVNLEGKEVRFGQGPSALYLAVTTATSCGAVNAMVDSFRPLAALVPLVFMQIGEVAPGGVGSGLYGLLIFSLLTVFVAGLMVGRTPEFLGKKIEAREMTRVVLFLLVTPAFILLPAAWATVEPGALRSLSNGGPHGFTAILYAFSSAVGNNGSAFGSLDADTPFWNLTLAGAMAAGRILPMILGLAVAGSLVDKKVVAQGPGTFPTHGWLFVLLLVAVVLLVSALTFVPALALGPVLEGLLARGGTVF